jgi:hypothetical protein
LSNVTAAGKNSYCWALESWTGDIS